ncbi:hypothetical protein [Microbacterium sp. NIBRBAC000506063]|nr:hypothetical protein [Microbacterium sp. NIBRBAC000506063]
MRARLLRRRRRLTAGLVVTAAAARIVSRVSGTALVAIGAYLLLSQLLL